MCVDFYHTNTRTARITANKRWVIGGHLEHNASTLSVSGTFGVSSTTNLGGALTGTSAAFSGAITGYSLAVTADNSGWNPGIDLVNTNADSSPCYFEVGKD